MLKNFLINAMRNMSRQRGYILLNVAGLTIGLISFLFITLYVIHEFSYDKFHENYENIYRIKIVGRMSGGELDQAVTAAPMAQAILKDYPEVLHVTRARGFGDWLIMKGDKKYNENKVLFADSTFFDVFGFRLIKGDPKSALVRPRSIILSAEYAKKYFGNEDPIGQRLELESDTVFYTVTGIVENVPDISHISFDMLASLSTYPRAANNDFWVSHNFYTYVVVKDGVDKDELEKKFQGMIENYVGPQIKQFLGFSIEDFRKQGNDFTYVLEPLKDIHLKGATQYNLEPPGSLTTVLIFSIIAILILIVAIINYVNLATAKSASRAKEVGVRKVSGAGSSGLMLQFISESILIVSFSALLAILLVMALSPAFSNLTGKEISLDLILNPKGIISFIGLILFTGVAAGFYPAFVLASFNPVTVLKGTMSPGSMSKRLRGILVVFQFTVSIIIVIGSIIVYKQLNFMTNKDLGYEKEKLLVIKRADSFWRQRESFRTRLLEIPGIQKVGFTSNIPGEFFSNNAFFNDNDPEKKTYLINQGQVSFDFPEALGVTLTEGRSFSREFGTDSSAIMINESTVKALGLKDPIGKYILQPGGPDQWFRLKIIGVMKDFYIESMHKTITPVCFTVLRPGGGDQFAVVRLTGSDIPSTIKAIEQLWQTFTPNMPFQYEFFADKWANLYSSELKTGRIFIIFSFLAIFIACLGLIGLVTYITNKRTREIGIRKTYGASIQAVLGLLSKEVILLILISSLIAYPVAWYGSRFWLEGFATRVNINPLIYLLATLVALCIGWLSTIYQTIKAANYSPANALRND